MMKEKVKKSILAYRYRLYPTKTQVAALERALDICRDVHNSLVHERTVLYETTGKSPCYLEPKRSLPVWKGSHAELCDVHSQVLQSVIKRVDLAFQAFFRRIREGDEPDCTTLIALYLTVHLFAGQGLTGPHSLLSSGAAFGWLIACLTRFNFFSA
jgi:hypothetical protein